VGPGRLRRVADSLIGAAHPTTGTPPPPGVRVVLDLRPLQDPDRGPVTATYLDELLTAFAANPLPGESFTFVLETGLPDPSNGIPGIDRLDVAGRRRLPPTHVLRSGALTLDPFLLRAAALGTAWRAGTRGAAGSVYHAAGGAVPIASGLPLVVTLLDLAPWELPVAYQRTPTARFGQRLRARLLQRADVVIVASETVATTARRLLRLRPARIRVVRLAARAAFHGPIDRALAAAERERRGLPERYFLYTGRHDARQDVGTLFEALRLTSAERPARSRDLPWPPRILVVGATPDDRSALARAAERQGVGDQIAYAPRLDDPTLAALVAGARAVLLPALTDAAGLAALDSLAAGTPVVASATGALSDVVGGAGFLVGPSDPPRLAAALRAAWSDDTVHRRLVAAARQGAVGHPRTWADVASETRRIYAEVGAPQVWQRG
jgi:glycosyltransferase involved in cell wall biosynthesis